MESLLAALRAVEVDNDLLTPLDPESVILSDESEKVRAAVLAAEAQLITKDGQPNWDTIEVVRGAGFPVFKGESDGFGWLNGCILTSKGIIVFG